MSKRCEGLEAGSKDVEGVQKEIQAGGGESEKVSGVLSGVLSDLGDVALGDSSVGRAEAGGDGSSSRS